MNGLQRLPRSQPDKTAAAIEATAPWWRAQGSALYEHLCRQVAQHSDLVAIAAHGLASMEALHLFACVHYLLLRDARDPLAQYYATLTKRPAPPDQAFPEFARFCMQRREEIVELLDTRTVQATQAERCRFVLPVLSHVARLAGEPLNLIEIGCSAGVLLTLDKYAYNVKGQGRLGSGNSSLTLNVDVRDTPHLHIPRIGERIGVDLRPVDVRLEDERRWLLALCLPENHEEQTRLAAALDTVAQTHICFFKGDALDLTADLVAKTPDPLCVFHSACLVYWSEAAKAEFDALLVESSRGREFYRVGIEPDLARARQSSAVSVDMIITRYRDGATESKVVAQLVPDTGLIMWLE